MGGSSHAENDAVVEEQKKQAADAERKEQERKARIQRGTKRIQWAFNGRPVMEDVTNTFRWKGFNDKTVLPEGYKRVQVGADGKPLADIPGRAATPGGFHHQINAGQPGQGGSPGTAELIMGSPATEATPATGGTTAIIGPDGKIYMPGQKFDYTTSTPTGQRKGGFNQAFYDKYKNSYIDYYNADIADQLGKAESEAAFRLNRAGLGVSSAATDLDVDLQKQNAANQAGVANQADALTADLKRKVAQEKKGAIDQLYQTEDPTLAANTALSSVRNLSLETPDLSPLAQVFNIAAVGGANLLKNFNNQKAYNDFNTGLPGGAGSSRNV